MRIESSQLLKVISEGFPGLMVYVDKDYCYQFVNEKWSEWTGRNPAEILKKKVTEVMDVESFNQRKPYFDRAFRGERVKFIAALFHHTLGMRDVEQCYQPDFAPDGTVTGVLVIAYDITDQKVAEREAKENEARFRSLTEMMPQLVWITDENGKAIWFNENWHRRTGTRYEDNLGLDWIKALHPDDRKFVQEDWQNTLNKQGGNALEYRLRMADGSYRWHLARAIPIHNEKNEIVRWVGTTTDIQQQKNEKLLTENERNKLYSFLMQIPVPIYILMGPDLIVDLINSSAAKKLAHRELKNRPLREALPELVEQGYVGLLENVYKTGKGQNFSARPMYIKNPDGSKKEYYFDIRYEPLSNEDGDVIGVLNVSIDVTDQVFALKSAEEALKVRDSFLSVASHELKTPLTSLKLQSQMTMRLLEQGSKISYEKQMAMSQQTNELVGRLTRLIDDMLDVSRIRTGKLRLEKDEHDLGDIVREVVQGMSLIFEAAHLELPSIEEKEKIPVFCDRFRIEQVIGNLLTNAIRYGRNNPIRVKIERKGKHAIISVSDGGYGISQNDVERIFDQYERAINEPGMGGMGLGLFISKEIVNQHGGSIWVESELGRGSTFYVSLPLNQA